MVSEPAQENNILDLFLKNSPTLVDSVSIIPGIADRSVVMALVRLRSTTQKVKPRTVHLYSKADWESMRVCKSVSPHFSHPVMVNRKLI